MRGRGHVPLLSVRVSAAIPNNIAQACQGPVDRLRCRMGTQWGNRRCAGGVVASWTPLLPSLIRSIAGPSKVPMPNKRIVHVVVDDEAVRLALGLVLGAAGYVCRLHKSAAAFLAAPADDMAGCVVAGVRRPRPIGPAFEKWLKRLAVGPPVIVVTGQGDVSMAVSAIKAGAFDFIEESVDAGKLLAAVAAALKYRHEAAGRHAAIERVQKHLRTLSGREHEVLDGLLLGRPNKAMARDLGVSCRTIEVYRARLMLKMHAESLPGLVRMALMAGGES
jgi:two-component system response regulator FixJ